MKIGIMKYYVVFILFASFYTMTFAQKQNHLVLQHKKNSNRFKELLFDEFYKIKLIDTVINSKIFKFTDSTLTIMKTVLTDIDTVYSFGEYGTNKIPGKKYYNDTIIIQFSDVQYIKIDWFKNRDFAILPAYVALVSTVAIPFVTVLTLIESGQVDLETLAIVTSISVISLSILFIATRERKYDTQKKWILTMKE